MKNTTNNKHLTKLIGALEQVIRHRCEPPPPGWISYKDICDAWNKTGGKRTSQNSVNIRLAVLLKSGRIKKQSFKVYNESIRQSRRQVFFQYVNP